MLRVFAATAVLLSVMIALVTLALTASAASAQDRSGAGPDRTAMRTACQDDFRKLCPGVRPGGGRIRDCMRAHENELSPACRSALRQAGSAPR